MVLYLFMLIMFSLHRESLKLILVDNPPPPLRWFCHIRAWYVQRTAFQVGHEQEIEEGCLLLWR
jgi:hypothetical protein